MDEDFYRIGDLIDQTSEENDDEREVGTVDPFSRTLMNIVFPTIREYLSYHLAQGGFDRVEISKTFLVSLLQESVRALHFLFSSFPLSDEDIEVVLDRKPFCSCGTLFSEGEILGNGRMACPKCGKVVFEDPHET